MTTTKKTRAQETREQNAADALRWRELVSFIKASHRRADYFGAGDHQRLQMTKDEQGKVTVELLPF